MEQIHQFFRLVITDTFAKDGIANLKDDIEAEIETKKLYAEEALNSDGEKRYFVVAYAGKQLVGTIDFGPTSNLIKELSKGEIDNLPEVGSLLVHPKFQKKGIGNKLLLTIFQTLKEKGVHEFCFDSGYKKAQIIWTKKFGVPTVLVKNYWGVGNHHMIWRKRVCEVLPK